MAIFYTQSATSNECKKFLQNEYYIIQPIYSFLYTIGCFSYNIYSNEFTKFLSLSSIFSSTFHGILSCIFTKDEMCYIEEENGKNIVIGKSSFSGSSMLIEIIKCIGLIDLLDSKSLRDSSQAPYLKDIFTIFSLSLLPNFLLKKPQFYFVDALERQIPIDSLFNDERFFTACKENRLYKCYVFDHYLDYQYEIPKDYEMKIFFQEDFSHDFHIYIAE